VRLFLAGVVPEAVKQTLHTQLAPVRAATPQARWLPADTLHLTLVFLGAVPDASVLPLQAAFGGVCGRHHAVHLTLGGVETFGPTRSPRVLATTLAGDVEGLHALITEARHAAEPLVPLEPERPFRPISPWPAPGPRTGRAARAMPPRSSGAWTARSSSARSR
jgi:2'-5' RNA ligase